MKKVPALLVLGYLSAQTCFADTNYLCGVFGTPITAGIATTRTSFPSQVVLVEGQWSDQYSSARREADYFLIPTVSTNNGRFLLKSPFSTSDSSPWYGIVDTSAVFTDVLTGERFIVPLTRISDDSGIREEGTLIIDDRYVYILNRYGFTARYPTMKLTWGLGASYGDNGLDVDSMVCPSVPPTAPPNRISGIHLVSDETGSVGAFLTLDQPLHYGHDIQYSFDLLDWHTIERGDLLLNSNGKKIYYQSPGHAYQFFRLILTQ